MSEEEQTTLHLIRSAAMQEFLKKGFTMTARKIYLNHW